MRKLPVSDFEELRDTINHWWKELYGGEPVYDIPRLKNRVLYIADDRNCWLFNAKQAEKEVVRLSALASTK